MKKFLKRFWIIFKAAIAIWTIMTLMTFFIWAFPFILNMEVVQRNPWMAYTFVIVMFFWSGYIGVWGSRQFKGWKK